MKSNTQNAKIEAITEKTLVLGIDVGSETHYARAFDYRGIEYSKKPFKFSNTEAGFVTFKECLTVSFGTDVVFEILINFRQIPINGTNASCIISCFQFSKDPCSI